MLRFSRVLSMGVCICWCLAAPALAQLCPPGASGDCFTGNGTPGCADPTCCEAVCAIDSFCCNTEWDDICADEAADLCAGAPSLACCFTDGTCVDLTSPDCDAMGGSSQGPGTNCLTTPCPIVCPGVGDCFDPEGNGSPGCIDGECCEAVCAIDSFCCETEWDDICAEEAIELCAGAPCVRCPGDVNFDDNRDGLDVQAMVTCLLDPANGPGQRKSAGCACADADNDNDVDLDDIAIFVSTLVGGTGECPVCGPGNGACFDLNGNGSPGCEDAECCAAVCAADPLCCDGTWDGFCAAEANVICNGAPSEACCFGTATCFDFFSGDCLTLGGTPGGEGTTCATIDCTSATCGPGAGACFDLNGNGTPGCEDPACCAQVCAADSFCCNSQWDGLCAAEANVICNGAVTEACCDGVGGCVDIAPADCSTLGGLPQGPGSDCGTANCNAGGGCGDPGAGDCFTNTGSPFCSDADCCNAVCAVDAFCCDTAWDGLCAAEAQGICAGAVTEACCIFGGCADAPPADCAALGGTPGGPGSSCAFDPCP